MKTLANCKPSEFLSQTYKIKKSVEKWLDITKVLDIRKEMPDDIIKITDTMTVEEKGEAFKLNKEAFNKKAYENLSKMLDSMLGEHPDETLELIALICFIEPKDIDNYTTSELLANMDSILSDENVLGFFSSLMRSGQMVTPRQ